MARFLVGLGNWNMSDDAVGLRLVERFSSIGCPNGFETDIAHQDAMRILFHFDPETEEIIVVDAVQMGRAPGDWQLFSPQDVSSLKENGEVSTHEGDVLKVVEFARKVGLPIPRIRILGIEPGSMEWGQALSAEVAARMDEYEQVLREAMLRG